jgi:SAM-dependent methyltransferase
MDRMTKDIGRLKPTAATAWVGYEGSNTYSAKEEALKLDALGRLVAMVEPRRLVVDLGANTGRYSVALADVFARVIALDLAEGAVEQLYQRVRAGEVAPHVTPAATDLLDPTPARGLMNQERLALFDRLEGADLFVWLALIHHLVISRNVPLGLVATMARRLGRTHIIEHIGPDDPMSRLLSASKPETSWPLDRATFEQAMRREFVIAGMEQITPHRHLYLLEAARSAAV